MGYRTRDEIYTTMLETSKEGVSKSHMMHRAYLGYEQFVKYIAELLKLDLVQYNTIDKKYHITLKGREYLAMREKFLCAPSVV